jgi:hypothetical protein
VGKTYERIDGRLRTFIEEQPLFFTATAPLSGDGTVNLSPKGLKGSFAVLDELTVAYLDFAGSNAETIAHLRENGRIVVMLCAFAGPPRILRLHGRGTVHLPGEDAYEALLAACGFDDPSIPEARRSIVRVEVTRVADSCGYGVPLMSYEGQRVHAEAWAAKRVRTHGAEAMRDYSAENNAVSIDGLPALEQA